MKSYKKMLMMIVSIVMIVSCNKQMNEINISQGNYHFKISYKGERMTPSKESEMINQIAHLVDAETGDVTDKVIKVIEKHVDCDKVSWNVQLLQGEKSGKKDYRKDEICLFVGSVAAMIAFIIVLHLKDSQWFRRISSRDDYSDYIY